MRDFVKFFIVVILLLCTSITFSSCRKPSSYQILHINNQTVHNKKITLRFISQWAGYGLKTETLKRVLDNFMKENPDIEVINESMSGEDFLLKLKTDLASGNDPDVFALWPGANMTALIKANKIADLTPILEADSEWQKSFDRSAWYYVTDNNKIYGVPLEFIYQCLFINKDMFEAYQIKVPENFDELKNAVKGFRNQGVIPIAFNTQNDGSMIYQNIIASLGGRTSVEAGFQDGKVSPCYIQAIKYMKELYDLKAFPDNAFTLSSKDRDDLFLHKKAAMIVQGSEFIGEVNKQWTLIGQNADVSGVKKNSDKQITVDMIPFPSVGGKGDPTAIIYGLGSGTFFMSKVTSENSDKKAASIRLLKYLTSVQTAILFAEQTRMLSSVKAFPPNAYYSNLMIKGFQLIDGTKELITPPDCVIDRSIWEKVVLKQLPYVLEDKEDAQTVWDQALESYNDEK